MDCRQDRVPDFNEVAASGVAEDAEGGIGCVGGEDVADELVALDDAGIFSWEASNVEDGFEVAVAFDEPSIRGLEVGFGELGFEEQVAELQVDLGAVLQMSGF